MRELLSLWQAKGMMIKNNILSIGRHSKLKIGFILTLSSIFLGGGFFILHNMLSFLYSLAPLGPILIDRLLSFFFLILFLMLIFSNIIVSFSTLYQSKEVDFLISVPLSFEEIFFTKFLESLFFSSWAFLFLGAPLMLSYGLVVGVRWHFYLIVFLFFLPFLFLPAGIGTIITMVLARAARARRSRVILIGLIILVVPIILFGYRFLGFWRFDSTEIFALINQVLNRLSFTQFPLLPNYWVVVGIIAAVSGDWSVVSFHFLLVLSNCLFMVLISIFIAKKIYYPGFSLFRGGASLKTYPPNSGLSGRLERSLSWLSSSTRSLVMKDIRFFLRDPAQWSQFAIFFGLIAIYICNLRNMSYDLVTPKWKNIISFVNLGAMGLTLSSLTTRFTFPIFSLEGKRFWLVGMAPFPWRKIVLTKFWLTVIICLLITESLTVLSNIMLKTPPLLLFLSCWTVFLMSFSLVALSIGLGVICPDFKSDNPAQIVSGMGGTLDFILSLIYVLVVATIMALPLHLYVTKEITSPHLFHLGIVGALICVLFLSLLTTLLPLGLALRHLKQMEF